jgi:hypothetical protein
VLSKPGAVPAFAVLTTRSAYRAWLHRDGTFTHVRVVGGTPQRRLRLGVRFGRAPVVGQPRFAGSDAAGDDVITAVIEAMKTIRFDPLTVEGCPVRGLVQMPFQFNLSY